MEADFRPGAFDLNVVQQMTACCSSSFAWSMRCASLGGVSLRATDAQWRASRAW